jgi:tetratricopeptide (TPR) repeat protein
MTNKLKTSATVLFIFLSFACHRTSILQNPGVTLPEPKESAPVSPKSASLQEQGVVLFSSLAGSKGTPDDLVRALALLDEAAREDPNNHLAYSAKGGIYLSVKNYSEAARAFGDAAKIKPDAGEYYMGQAIALQRTGDEGGAKTSCRYAIAAFNLRLQKNPDDPSRVDRATAAYLLGHRGVALDEFQAILKTRPDDIAAAEMKKFIESNPSDPWSFLGI